MALRSTGQLKFSEIEAEFGANGGRTLGNYRISQTVGQLTNLPLDDLIGTPLTACAKAQQLLAKTTVDFIRDVGMDVDLGDPASPPSLKVVSFSYSAVLDEGTTTTTETKTITVENLPEHEHDLRAASGEQFFAVREVNTGDTTPTGTSRSTFEVASQQNSQRLPTSGGVLDGGNGDAIDVMNPFLAMKYIIYTGRSSV